MQGFNVLFQPGYDHAGISTQNAVEKHLALEGKTRHDLGREAFEERVWEWLREYGGKIMLQFRRIGASLDYRRERFTMDDAYVRAVMRFFVHLWDKGWIYRANRISNWCPYHLTSLSDLELAHDDVDDALTYVRYPFADGDGHITIATVRPATILGDVAVAVHPEDERYRTAIGREVVVPWVERRVPVIADERVEREFGTGALKITPAHDPTDYEIGLDHGLPELTVIGPDGRMNAEAGGLAGLTQDEAEERVLAWLRERDQIEKRESYRHTVSLCDRCKTRIEPRISLQWWCAMEELKQPALDALRSGRVRFHPESQHRFAIASLEDAPDWNISRQIWWGHQLPLWECPDGHVTVQETEPDGLPRVRLGRADALDRRARHVVQLGALAVRDARLARRHRGPAHLLSRRHEHDRARHHPPLGEPDDLLRARADGRGPVHRRRHPLDRARADRRAHVEEARHRHGPARADRRARRGRDALRADEDGVVAGRALLRGGDRRGREAREQALERRAADRASRRGSRAGRAAAVARGALDPRAALAVAARASERLLDEFDFAHLMDELYHLTFDDFCDWYLEAVKQRLYDGDADARATATAALERLLKLLHPAMPHVTEEIWSHLPARATRLIVAPWPEAGRRVAGGCARARAGPRADVPPLGRRAAARGRRAADLRRGREARARYRQNGNADAERERLREEVARAEKMLANERFVQNAPAEVVAAEREKLERYRRELDAIGG